MSLQGFSAPNPGEAAGIGSFSAPCGECGKEIASSGHTGYCISCGKVWMRCYACGRLVETLAHFCGLDRTPVAEPGWMSTRPETRFQSLAPKVVRIPEEVWHAPIAYGGYLWVVSTQGMVYRVSPAGLDPKLVADLGIAFGRHAVGFVPEASLAARCLASLSGAAGPHDEEGLALQRVWGEAGRILLAIVGDDRIALLDPANPESPKVSPDTPNDRPFVSRDQGFPGVAAIGNHYATLQHAADGVALYIWNSANDATESVPLGRRRLCGPFAMDGHFAVYTGDAISYTAEGKLVSMPFPFGFRAFLDPDTDDFELPWGRSPYMQSSGGVYVPGTQNGRTAMAWIRKVSGRFQFSSFELSRGAAYRSLSNGLMLSEKGRLRMVMRAAVLPVYGVDDPQIIPGPVVHGGGIHAAMAQPSFSRRQVRLFPGTGTGADVQDGLPLDLFLLPGCLSMTRLNASHQLEIDSWPIE